MGFLRNLGSNLLANLILAPATAGAAVIGIWRAITEGDPLGVVLVILSMVVFLLLVYMALRQALIRAVNNRTLGIDVLGSGGGIIAAGGGGGGGGGGGAGPVPPTPQLSQPDVRIHVVGNTASQEWLRWFHLVAFNESETIAKDVRIEIFVMGATGGSFRRWMWTGGEEFVDLRKGRPVEIPLFIAALEDHPESPQYRVVIPKGHWYLTDVTFLKDGKAVWPLLPAKNHRYAAQLVLHWTDGVREVGQLRQCFSIRIPPPEFGEEADVLHVDCDG